MHLEPGVRLEGAALGGGALGMHSLRAQPAAVAILQPRLPLPPARLLPLPLPLTLALPL